MSQEIKALAQSAGISLEELLSTAGDELLLAFFFQEYGPLQEALGADFPSIGTPTEIADAAAADSSDQLVVQPPPGGSTTFSGDLDLDSNNIVNLATPANDTDATTRLYVDIASGRRSIQGFSSSTSFNFNAGSRFNPAFPNEVPCFAVTDDFSEGDFTVLSDTQVQANFTGRCEVCFESYLSSGGSRACVAVTMKINGTPIGPISASSYIRNGSGHNTSSVGFSGYEFDVMTGDTIEIGSRRESSITASVVNPSGATGSWCKLTRRS